MMKVSKGLFLVSFLLFCTVTIWSQYDHDFSFNGERYTTADGLSQTKITDVFVDSYGFLWIGTLDGLNRYDGYNFVTYRYVQNDTTSIQNNYIHVITEDQAGNIWIGTNSGISILDRSKGIFNNLDLNDFRTEFFLIQSVFAIEIVDYSEIWIRTNIGLERLDLNEKKISSIKINDFNPDFQLPDNKVPLLVDKMGMVWLGSNNGLYSYNKKTGKLKHYHHKPDDVNSLTDNNIRALLEGENGSLWIGTANGLNKLDVIRSSFTRYNPPENYLDHEFQINSIYKGSENKIWILGKEAIISFDTKNLKYNVISSVKVSNHDYYFQELQTIDIDKFNILWLGCHQGLFKIDLKPAKFDLLSSRKGFKPFLKGENVNAVLKDSRNNLWLGYHEDGLEVFFDGNTNSSTLFFDNMNLEILSLYEDDRGRIWIGTSEGIYIWDLNSGNMNPFNAHFRAAGGRQLKDKWVFQIIQDIRGNFWFACKEGLYAFKEKTNTICSYEFIYNDKGTVPVGPIFSIIETDSLTLWLGTIKGVLKFDQRTDLFYRQHFKFDHNCSLDNSIIHSLESDENSNLWIGTNYGLYRVNSRSGENECFCELQGLADNNILKLINDRNQSLWLSTNNGISELDIEKNIIINYHLRDGLQGVEFNPRSGCLAEDGEIFFGGIYGVNRFYPDLIRDSLEMPKIIISRIEIIDREGNSKITTDKISDAVNVGYNQALRIDFSVSDFTNPKKNSYMYSFTPKGELPQWKLLNNTNSVTFTHLADKTYQLIIKGSNSYSDWDEDGATLEIVVLSPFWRSKLALAIYILALLVILYNVFQYRTHSLRKSNRILRERDIAAREVSRQKDLLSRRTKNIEDSLKYAHRIQASLLTTEKNFRQILQESFILHKPKDIVSGDFYWVYEIKNKVFVAAADCTGHGVPGAFMSLIGLELFRKIIITQKVNKPGEILNALNDNFQEIFGRGEDISLRDGMDLAFCVIDKKEMVIEYAGAFNPLYIIRDKKLIEVKGDRFSIGADSNPFEPYAKMFTNQTLKIYKDDMIYLFSDGFADQFGGPEGKKYKYRRFRHLLLTIHSFPLQKQKQYLEDSIEEWRGPLDQVDDILVIGIKANF